MIQAMLSSSSVKERLSEALMPEKVRIFGNFEVGPSMFTALAVTAFLLAICVVLRLTVIRKLRNVPKKPQILIEMIVKAFDKLAKDATHDLENFVGPYVMAAASFICVSTLVELLGIRPALADINTCFALGFSTFVVIHFFGVKKRGLGIRLKRMLNPINIITDIAVPVSLSFRLFGSIVSGLLIMELIYSYIALSFVLPVLVSVITTLFHALIQAYIFSTLSSLFIGEAVEIIE